MKASKDHDTTKKRNAGYREYHKICCSCEHFDSKYTHCECSKLKVEIEAIACCKHFKEIMEKEHD